MCLVLRKIRDEVLDLSGETMNPKSDFRAHEASLCILCISIFQDYDAEVLPGICRDFFFWRGYSCCTHSLVSSPYCWVLSISDVPLGNTTWKPASNSLLWLSLQLEPLFLMSSRSLSAFSPYLTFGFVICFPIYGTSHHCEVSTASSAFHFGFLLSYHPSPIQPHG